MKKNIFHIIAIAYCNICYSQPYLDIARVNYTYSPKEGLNKKTNPLVSNDYDVNLTLPLELKKGGDAILINPFLNYNQGSIDNHSFHLISEGAGTGFLKKFKNKEWSLLSVFFLRRNKEVKKRVTKEWQYGGAVVATWKKSTSLELKLGIYYNKEFKNQVIPLAGIDWEIDERNNLFGLLPGNLVFEHKVSRRFFYGAAFRALTNAYSMETTDPCLNGDCSGQNYLRISDNQLGLFGDVYITPKIVFTSEIGYTVLRKYRFGFKGSGSHNHTDYKNDNFYLRASLVYRLHLK